jgi:nucleoside-diphosphate-sugar epimerase
LCSVWRIKSPIINEESVCKPETWEGDPGRAYGIMKFTIERLCLLYFLQYQLPVTAFRIDLVFTENNALPSSETIDNVKRGRIIEVVECDSYSGIHVDDVIQVFLLATLNKNAYGQVFNLSNPASHISYRELYELLIQLTRSKSRIKLIKDPTHISSIMDPAKIQKELGWKPQKTKEDLKQAIIKSVEPQ